ncbi:MAG: hypothetical protein P8174_01515 [Gemmatimonadota bacterium]
MTEAGWSPAPLQLTPPGPTRSELALLAPQRAQHTTRDAQEIGGRKPRALHVHHRQQGRAAGHNEAVPVRRADHVVVQHAAAGDLPLLHHGRMPRQKTTMHAAAELADGIAPSNRPVPAGEAHLQRMQRLPEAAHETHAQRLVAQQRGEILA